MEEKKKCAKCGKNFLIIAQEKKFLKKKGLPLPDNCPTCRQARRLALRSQRKLVKSKCDKCGKAIVITFDPVKDQPVYCKKCFREYYDKTDLIIKEPLPE
jgi:CxxC-x17-CxxC domain-containing protein